LFLYSSVSWLDWGTLKVFLLYCFCPESDKSENDEIVKKLKEIGFKRAVDTNPNDETFIRELKDLDNQKDLTGTLVLFTDVKKQEFDVFKRHMFERHMVVRVMAMRVMEALHGIYRKVKVIHFAIPGLRFLAIFRHVVFKSFSIGY